MFDTCFLHIGQHKTGSTSIQQSLFKNREAFGQLGLHIPSQSSKHVLLGSAMEAEPRPRRASVLRGVSREEFVKTAYDYRDAMLAEFEDSTARNLVLTSESFFLMRPREFRRLLDFCRKVARRVQVVAYVREPADRLLSQVQQRIKVGKPVQADFAPSEVYKPTTPQLDAHKAVLGDAEFVVRPFDRAQLERGDVVSDFLSVVGIPPEACEGFDMETANTSLSHEAVLLAAAYNAAYPTKIGPKVNPERSHRIRDVLQRISGAKHHLTESQRQQAAEIVAEDRAQLQEHYGLVFPDRPAPDPQALWQGETLTDLAHVLNDLLRENTKLRQRLAASKVTL